MISAETGSVGRGALLLTGIDHVGLVVRDAAAEAVRWRALGFLVSDPTALHDSVDGTMQPLGQISAHVVFENGYVEISSPIPGAGNHLEAFLALGEGVRIVVHAADDIDAAHTAAAAGTARPRLATRTVLLPGGDVVARFAWFALTEQTLPGALSAVVAHLDRDAVFHPSLTHHPNGLRRIDHLLASGDPRTLRRPVGVGQTEHGVLALRADPDDASGPLRVTRFVGRSDNRLGCYRIAE